jgi:hypothetical protein
MKKTFLVSASAIALAALPALAIAQEKGREAPQAAPPAMKSAPAEKMAPRDGAAPGASQSAPKAGTTGQAPRTEQDRPQGAQSPGTRDSQKGDAAKPGDTRAGEQPKSDGKPAAAGKSESQGTTTGQGPAGTAGASLTTEQRTKIKTTIKQTNVRPVTNVNFTISVGAVVPRTVELHPLPPAIIEIYPAWRGYRFVLVGDEIVIIEPSTYRIVAVIEA